METVSWPLRAKMCLFRFEIFFDIRDGGAFSMLAAL
jgi:hypothetical protein